MLGVELRDKLKDLEKVNFPDSSEKEKNLHAELSSLASRAIDKAAHIRSVLGSRR